MSLHLISTTFDFPSDFLNNLIQNLSKSVRIDNSALKVLKLVIYLERRLLPKLNPLENFKVKSRTRSRPRPRI